MRAHVLLTLGLGGGLLACLGGAPSFDFGGGGPGDAGSDGSGSYTDSDVPADLASIRGLVLWVRSDRGVTLADGGTRVSGWADQSTEHRDLSAFSGDEPVYRPAADGGEALVDFDGQRQYLINPSALGIGPDGERTFLVVARPKDGAARAPLFVQTYPTDKGFDAYAIEANTFNSQGNRYGLYLMGSAFDSNQAVDVDKFGLHVIRARIIGAGDDLRSKIEYRFNGAPQALTLTAHGGTGAAVLQPNPTETALGAFSLANGGRLYGACAIVEAAVFDRALSDEELEAAERELERRHGI